MRTESSVRVVGVSRTLCTAAYWIAASLAGARNLKLSGRTVLLVLDQFHRPMPKHLTHLSQAQVANNEENVSQLQRLSVGGWGHFPLKLKPHEIRVTCGLGILLARRQRGRTATGNNFGIGVRVAIGVRAVPGVGVGQVNGAVCHQVIQSW